MRFTRSRAAVLGAAALTMTLTACAPPGQDGDPGVAATYEGTTITNAGIDATYRAWLDDTDGLVAVDRGHVLTIDLLRDDMLDKAAELGYNITLSTAETYADQWLVLDGVEGEASDEAILSTQGVLALMVVAYDDTTLAGVKEISDRVAQSAVLSPRAGAYSTEALLASVQAAMLSADTQQLGQYTFSTFRNVSAFTDADQSWFDRG